MNVTCTGKQTSNLQPAFDTKALRPSRAVSGAHFLLWPQRSFHPAPAQVNFSLWSTCWWECLLTVHHQQPSAVRCKGKAMDVTLEGQEHVLQKTSAF